MHIHLIRHGQANASGMNYDQLTEKGRQQAQMLGQRFRENGLEFKLFARGSLVRHMETLDGILEGMQNLESPVSTPANGREKPNPDRNTSASGDSIQTEESGSSVIVLEKPGLNEVDPVAWKSIAEEIASKDPAFSGMLGHLKKSEGSGRRRRLAAVTGRVLDFWIRGQSPDFLEFRTAVLESLKEIASMPGNGPALVVSSGTPMAIAIAEALGQSNPESIYHWLRQLSNTSYSILDISSRWKALQINSLDHLPMAQRSLM